MPCPTFEDCFAALIAGDVDLGMVPNENSVAGRVADIHHLMPTAELPIIAEWFLPIRNQLMAVKGANLRTIKTVQSHVMALGQCRNVIRELKLRPIVAAVTGAVRASLGGQGSEPRGDRVTASGGNPGLDILRENVEDDSHSNKRFVVLRARRNGQSRAPAESSRPSCSGCATFRLRSTRRSADLPRTAST